MNALPIDHAVRQQALDIRQSFAVSAPAGSGKTALLTQRILHLLAHADQPENILAMTFTRKAADEMQQRIVAALQLAASGETDNNPYQQTTLNLAAQVLERDREKQWQLLISPQRLRIQTIDSFCQHLVEQLPSDAAVRVAMRPTENAQHLYQQSVRDFLQLLQQPPFQQDMARLLSHVDNNLLKLESLLIDLLRKRNQWLGVLYKNANAEDAEQILFESMQRNVAAGVADCESVMQILLPELLPLLLYAATNNNETDQTIAEIQQFNAATAGLDEKIRLWKRVADTLLTADKNPDACQFRKTVNARDGFPAAKDKNSAAFQHRQSMLTVLHELSGQEKVLQYLHDIKALPNLDGEHQQAVISSLTRLLPHLVARLQLVCREQGECDFDEIAQAAITTLGDEYGPSDLALRLDYQIKHILVDEFQDTSLLQLSLLEKLTLGWQEGDGRTLFVVGDAMQSCYGFRDAKVGLFLRVRQQGIGTVALTPLDLVVNFRSEKSIVDWVNEIFGSAFPAQDNLRRGAVRFHPAQASSTVLNSDAVQVFGFTNTEHHNQKIVRLVQHHLAENDHDSIAILARTRTQLPAILAALRDADIVWEAQDIDALRAQMAVVDLYSLTKALCDWSDRISWLAILRAPWCGLDMHDLTVIANGRSTIWSQILHFDELTLSPAGVHILQRLRAILSAAFLQSHRQPFRQWLQGIWLALGGTATIANPSETESVKHYFSLLEKYCGAWGINDWRQFDQALDRLYANSAQVSRVQVMTLHKSKGLEFDVVILPHLEKVPHSDSKDLLLWEDSVDDKGNINFLLSATAAVGEQNSLYDYLWREQGIARDLESTRLLYVACTRAIKQLYLCACLKTDNQGTVANPPSRSLLEKVWPTLSHQFTDALARDNDSAAQGELFTSSGNESDSPPLTHILRLPPDRPPVLFHEDKILHPYQHAPVFRDQTLPDADKLINRYQRYCGTVIHRALEIACRHGWRNYHPDQQSQVWRVQLRQLGTPDFMLDDLCAIIRHAVTSTLSDSTGQWLLDNTHTASVCEWRLSGLDLVTDRTTPKEWVIDRSFIDQGIRWVIDYKSSVPESGQAVDEFLLQEAQRYQLQLQTYQRAILALDTGAPDSQTPVKTALYFPRLAQFYPLADLILQ